jgi:methionyl aminopeptidase
LNDKTVFKEDMVKLDIGVHIDGYIADTAITVDLSGNPELVKAAESALKAAIETIHGGVNTSEIGAAIEEAIKGYGYKPVGNLTGHGLAQYIQHGPPTIPNVRVSHGVALKVGEIVAIEPFATNGSGRVYDAGNAEIYHTVAIKPIRLPTARALLKEIEIYKTLPFAKRWLTRGSTPSTPGGIDFALTQLVKAGIIKPYPILKEVNRGLVSQAEDTVLVTEDGCKVLTR